MDLADVHVPHAPARHRSHRPSLRCANPGPVAVSPTVPAVTAQFRAGGGASGLVGLGAAVVERFDDITVMADPEGNEFCVEPGPGDPHPASGR